MPPHRTWTLRFRDALRGIAIAITSERTFAIHIPAAVGVVGLGVYFQIGTEEWLALAGCITLVITAELLNTALERMAKAVTQEQDENVRTALDMGAGAVLAAALGAATVGLIIFGGRLLQVWYQTTTTGAT